MARCLPLATLAAFAGFAGCKTLLGIDDGVVNTDRADAASDTMRADGPDVPLDAMSPWWDPAFASRRPITIDTTGLTLPLANLPLLVRIPPEVAAELAPTAIDARFIADDGATVLPYEIETGGIITTGLVVWVKVTLATQNQRIWLYYDNAFAGAQSNPASVFGGEYVSVHHMSSNADASGNGHQLNSPGPASPNAVDAIIGRGFAFDGVSDFVELQGGDGPFDFTQTMSVSVWFKTPALTEEFQALVTKGDTSWRVQRNGLTNRLTFATGGPINDNVAGNTLVDDNQWHHVLVTRDDNAKSIYLDGVLDGTRDNPPAIPTNSNIVRIGGNQGVSGRSWNGAIDEVRISGSPRTAAWAKAEHAMVAMQQFATIGARETMAP